MTAIFFGFGMSAIATNRSIMPCSRGSSSAVTSLAPVVASTSLSDMKYWKKAIAIAIISTISQGIPANISSPRNSTYTTASIIIVKPMRKVSSKSRP